MTRSRRGYDDARSDSALIRETHSRVKRLETRVTAGLVAMGIDTPAQKPEFFEGDGVPRVIAPSRHCPLSNILDTIPKTCHGPVRVFVGSDLVAVVKLAASS